MRRKDREIKGHDEIDEIIQKAEVCHIAFADGGTPYLVALNFGYRRGDPSCFFFHCAPEGRKLEMLAKNDRVFFQLDTDHELVRADQACGWGMKFRSVAGMGILSRLDGPAQRLEALNCIMEHYSGKTSFDFEPSEMEKTVILKLEIGEITGKKKGY